MEKKQTSWFKIVFYIYLIGGVLFVFLGPMPKKVGGRSSDPGRRMACYSNLRIIQGAVEMYNMDVSTMMTDLDQSVLVAGNYIKSNSPLVCPYTDKNGIYKNNGDLTDKVDIICTYHGGFIIEGEYDKEEKEKEKNRRYQFDLSPSACLDRLPYFFVWPLCLHKDGVIIFVK